MRAFDLNRIVCERRNELAAADTDDTTADPSGEHPEPLDDDAPAVGHARMSRATSAARSAPTAASIPTPTRASTQRTRSRALSPTSRE
jgi:hypothetical protein